MGELAEQVPYLEWRHSDYRDRTSCQDCHMPEVEGETDIASVVGLPHENVSRHVFRGGNFFMPRLLNAHRAELGVSALPQGLEAGEIDLELGARLEEHLEVEVRSVTATLGRGEPTEVARLSRLLEGLGVEVEAGSTVFVAARDSVEGYCGERFEATVGG